MSVDLSRSVHLEQRGGGKLLITSGVWGTWRTWRYGVVRVDDVRAALAAAEAGTEAAIPLSGPRGGRREPIVVSRDKRDKSRLVLRLPCGERRSYARRTIERALRRVEER